MKKIYSNRKALHNYFIKDKFEAGIVLVGSEVKSCCNGSVDLSDAYVSIDNGELIMHNSFIANYKNSTSFVERDIHRSSLSVDGNFEKRKRKLLMHKKEILKLYQLINIKGFTLIPLSFYIKNRKIKVELALAKGKHNYDKRNSLKEKAIKQEIINYNDAI